MTVKEAETIVKAYSAYFAELNGKIDHKNGPWVFSSSELPWSPAKIKYAFFVFVEDLVKSGDIDTWFENIKFVYSTIDGLFKDNADSFNEDLTKLWAQLSQLKSEEQIEAARVQFQANHHGTNDRTPDDNLAGSIEIHNFVVDIQDNWRK